MGLTADGTLWTWGIDQGREPETDLISRVKLAQSRLKTCLDRHPGPCLGRHASLPEAAAAVDSVGAKEEGGRAGWGWGEER